MNRITTIAAILFVAMILPVVADGAEEAASIVSPVGIALDPQETLILFYSDACPHCHNQLRWMAGIEDDFPGIEFRRFEIQVQDDQDNIDYFEAVMDAYDSSARGWPRTVIGDKVFIGFDPSEGELRYVAQYQAHIGYANQLYQALTELENQ